MVTCGEDEPILQVDGPGPLAALVGDCLLLHLATPRVHPSDLFVFAREENLAAVPVPAAAQHKLWFVKFKKESLS